MYITYSLGSLFYLKEHTPHVSLLSVNWVERKPEIFKNSSPKNSGTLLKIKNISKDYTENDIKDIYNSLTRLIPPIKNDIQKIKYDDIFSINLNFKDVEDTYNKYSGSIESEFDTHDPHYRLVGAIDDEGKLEGKFIYLDRATKKFDTTDISETIWNKKHKPTCGDIYFDFKVWDRDKDSLKLLFKSDELEIEPQDFRTSLDERAGISIYRDGFRVFPYGESGNDWLDLDKRRIQNPSQRISNNQILGSVFIGSQTNPLLKDQSNREGILDGVAYSDFKTLLSNAISRIEKKRSQKKYTKINSTKLPRLFENMDISNVRSLVEEKYPNDNTLEKILSKKQKEINANITQVRNVLSSYSRLATLGSLVDRLVHEIRSPLSSIKHNSNFIKNDIEDKNLEQDIRKSILSRAEKITHNSDMISASIKRIDPFSARKIGRPKKVDVNELIIKVIDMFSEDINRNNINIHYDALECYATIDPGEFSVVLRNLLDNAIYWSSHPESHNPENPDIKITVKLINKTSLVLRVSDSGPGVKEEDKYRIFHPYVSNKLNEETRKEGTGLGLTIAGHLVEDIYKGELNLIQYGALEGATFEAIFNKRSS